MTATTPPHDPRPPVLGTWRGRDGAGAWTLTATRAGIEIARAAGVPPRHVSGAALLDIAVDQRWWRRPRVHLPADPDAAAGGPVTLHGLTRAEGRELQATLRLLHTRHQASSSLAGVYDWYRKLHGTLEAARTARRWIPRETSEALLAARPPQTATLQHLMVPPLWTALSEDERAALTLRSEQAAALIAATNEEILTRSLTADRPFLDTIESSPMTEEQSRAVLMLDNRVHVIASAGSGKTSVMVARAAYAVHRGFTTPEKILLLAFNKDAATELEERTRTRFAAAGLPHDGLRATTFHAFGLDIIGRATGRRPTVAPWVESGRETQFLADLVDGLRARDADYGLAWDMFRLLYARVGDDWTEDVPADGYDRERRVRGLETYGGDIVRSQGERLVADWLYLNGVRYEYEKPYRLDTATAQRRQYRPDFYYPDIDVWHEHWGVDAAGNPPPRMHGYRESMAWKKALHARQGTTLVETTWAGIMDRTDFPHLAHELRSRGIVLDWRPDRPTRGSRPVRDETVLRLVRTFLTHVKSSGLTRDQVEARLAAGRVANADRARLFLRLYWPLHDAWHRHLAEGGYVDFEDMLTQAAAHLEGAAGLDAGFEMVLVDEFQDASRARARMTRALVDRPGRYLLAVGDDWQSINRFAGADLTVLTRFHDYFGPGPTAYLTRTFRCHQSIVDAATWFVTRNPSQLPKTPVSVRSGPLSVLAHEGVSLVRAPDARRVPRTVAEVLGDLSACAAAQQATWTVDVLGRYRHDRDLLPAGGYAHLDVTFRTVHGAKGLEADYVVVPNLSSGTYGFPSQVADDPVLNLMMADPEAFEHAEERRLLYVAMTRARRGVILVAPRHTPSPFVAELAVSGLVRGGEDDPDAVVCPTCRRGFLVARTGPYGDFWACTDFPACSHTQNDDPAPPRDTPPPAARPEVESDGDPWAGWEDDSPF